MGNSCDDGPPWCEQYRRLTVEVDLLREALEVTPDAIRFAAEAMMKFMFAPDELPLDEDLRMKYYQCAQHALKAALNEETK